MDTAFETCLYRCGTSFVLFCIHLIKQHWCSIQERASLAVDSLFESHTKQSDYILYFQCVYENTIEEAQNRHFCRRLTENVDAAGFPEGQNSWWDQGITCYIFIIGVMGYWRITLLVEIIQCLYIPNCGVSSPKFEYLCQHSISKWRTFQCPHSSFPAWMVKCNCW